VAVSVTGCPTTTVAADVRSVVVSAGDCARSSRPIAPVPASANQRLPSGPAVISLGWLPNGSENCVTTPAGVIRPIRSARVSVNQRLPSGPRVIPRVWV
jgi:hypothetical protein